MRQQKNYSSIMKAIILILSQPSDSKKMRARVMSTIQRDRICIKTIGINNSISPNPCDNKLKPAKPFISYH